MATLRHAPVSLIWSIAKAIETRDMFKTKLDNVSQEWKDLFDVELDLTHESRMPVPYRVNRPQSTDSDDGYRGATQMTLFTDQYIFGKSTYQRRAPTGNPNENHMRAKFDGDPDSVRDLYDVYGDDYTQGELFGTTLFLYAWGLAELFNDPDFNATLSKQQSGIKTIDPVNILPEVSEIQEEIVEIPYVDAVSLNFTVYTN